MNKKRSNKFKGKGNNPRNQKREDRMDKTADSKYGKQEWKEGYNDASWYTRNAQLNKDAGRIAFTWPLGIPFDFFNSSANQKINIPGIMTFRSVPTPGVSKGNNSVINIAARNIYSWVRHANSGHANYESANLMMYLMAMDSIYSMYAFMARIYGTIRTYSQRNRYYPKYLIEAQGVDFDSILNNLAQFRYFINQYAVKASSLCVPNVMTLYNRHIWMYNNYFTDGPLAKSRVYVHVPHWLYVYDEVNNRLNPSNVVTSNATRLTFDDIVSLARSMLNAILESEDMGIMSGDILKAYGESTLIRLNMISEDYMITPLYSDEILEQVANITINSLQNVSAEAWRISEDTEEGSATLGALLFTPYVNASGSIAGVFNAYTGKRLLSASDESPDEDRVIVMSRCTNIVDATDQYEEGSPIYGLKSAGSEVVVGASIFFLTAAGVLSAQDFNYATQSYTTGLTANLQVFHKHPTLVAVGTDGVTVYGIYQNCDNYAVVGTHELEKLHETALLSQFAVPYWGSGT